MSKLVVLGVSGAILAMGMGALVYTRFDSEPVVAPAATSAEPAADPPPTEIPPTPASKGYLALVVADQSVEVMSKLDGRIALLHVKVGERVEEGASLATLDAASVKNQIDSAEAQVRAARADAKQASA